MVRSAVTPAVAEALAAIADGAVDRARATLDAALASDLRDIDALHLAARMAIQMDPARAIMLLERAVVLAPRRPVLRNDLAAAYRLAGRTREATAALESALLIAPNGANAWLNLRMTRRALGNLSGAARALERALVFADSAKTWGALGMVRDAMGEMAGAIAAFRRMVALNPEAAEAHVNLAVAQARADDYAGALESATRAVAIDPVNLPARLNLGLFARHLGRRDEARAAFAWVLARDPGHAIAAAELAALEPS